MRTEDLQVGSRVVVVERSRSPGHRQYLFQIHTITRITKTQITLDNGERYAKRWGKRIGDSDSWYPKSLAYVGNGLMSVTEALERNKVIEAEIRRVSVATELSNFKWRTLSFNTLLNIMGLIQEATNKEA